MRIRTHCALLAVTAFVFASACSHPPPAAQAPTQSHAAGADAPHSGSIFFWRASTKGKPGSVYLLGSVHLRGHKSSLDRAITDAATQCERGAFEIDFDADDPNETNAFIQSEGMLKGQTLKDVVSPETFAAWSKAADANHLPRNLLEKFQPWMASLALQMAVLEKRGIVGDQGIDRMLYAFEKQEPTKSRKIVGLETALSQLRMFGSASPKIQDLMLRSTATEVVTDQAGKTISLYETGDEAGVSELLDKARNDAPELKPFMEALFDRRNAAMTEKIVPMFDTAGCAVVTVGAGHMVGESGIVRRLRDKGFDVERISSRGPTDASKMVFAVAKPKEFVSREDGFSVRTAIKPTVQEVPVPGIPVAHTYIFAEGVTTVTTVTVLSLSGAAASKIGAALEAVAKEGLSRVGVKVIASEPALIQGYKAVRVWGDSGQGDMRAGQSITWMHGDRLYAITTVSMSDGDAKKLDPMMNKFVEGFQHVP